MPKVFRKEVLVLLASLGVFLFTGYQLLHQKEHHAEVEIQAAHNELELAFATLSVRMSSMATALERAPEISPALYAELYDDLTRTATTVHERALALMPAMRSTAHLEAVTRRLMSGYRSIGYPDFRLFPEDSEAPLFPVVLVEPEASRPNVFGYNIGTSAERLAAAQEALERGVMTASEPVTLSQDADPSRASFLLLYPVYLANAALPLETEVAVLAAGMTPRALFTDHVSLNDRHILEISIGIGGVELPVILLENGFGSSPRFPLLQDVELPDIQTNGFGVPFRASVYYVPRVVDFVWPVLAAFVTGLVGLLAVSVSNAREASQRALETALKKKEAELRQAYRIQARSQRIEALGRLVGGVAHDFNNILSVILGNLDLIKHEGKAKGAEPFLDEAVAATMRGAHLTRQLLSVGRKSHLQPHRLNVATVLQQTSTMLGRVIPESITLTTVPAAGLWAIEADADGLQNALLNLALNARDAMEGRGKLIIEATNSRATQDYVDDRPEEEIPPGRYVVISVTDTGPGMPPAVMDRAFEPFFTTKHATEGSGLGLPSVLGFCRQSGGTCRIYSEEGIGTTVRMYFPAVDGGPEADVATEEPHPVANGVGRILVAEDEDSVAQVLVRQLQSAGYSVRRVSNGDAALAEIASGRDYDLLITDLVMPGSVQGAELARNVEALRPEIAILLISGYPQEAAIEGNGVATRHPVLTKPVPKKDLLQMIERLLQR